MRSSVASATPNLPSAGGKTERKSSSKRSCRFDDYTPKGAGPFMDGDPYPAATTTQASAETERLFL